MNNQQMNVIAYRPCFEKGAPVIFHDAADVRMEFGADVVSQPRLPVFRGENQMHENLSEGLRHWITPFQGLTTVGGLSQGVALGYHVAPLRGKAAKAGSLNEFLRRQDKAPNSRTARRCGAAIASVSRFSSAHHACPAPGASGAGAGYTRSVTA